MTLDFEILPSKDHGGYMVKYGTGHEQSATVQEVVLWKLLQESQEELERAEERMQDLESELWEIQKTLDDE